MKRYFLSALIGAASLLVATGAQATAPGENANLAASTDGILVGLPHSFPSAHTSTTFAGAEFIHKEYGWGWGAPIGDQPEEAGAGPGLSLEMHF